MIAARSGAVPMRDGTHLSVDVFRPDGPGPWPALVAISPYGKEIQSLPIPPQPPTAPVYAREIEAGDPVYLTDHGYVHVIADVRGTGRSEGPYRGWMSADEADDGHDLIEWAAAQDWCDGNVGMVGVSYYGTIQLAVAATQPPHLRAIMPFNAPADFYRESTHHGGILHAFFQYLYTAKARGRQVSAVVERSSPQELAALVSELEQDKDLQMYPDLYNTAINPERCPLLFDIISQPFDGPYYWERSAYRQYDRIAIPAYCASGWWAFAHMHLRGAFQNFASLPGPTKLWIESRVESPAPLDDAYNGEVVRWYDHWLKGIDNGIMEEPPIRLYVRNEGWRDAGEWPLADTRWRELYLGRWEQLRDEPETTAGFPDVFTQAPIEQTAAVASAEYLTPPLNAPFRVIGPAALYLHAEIDAPDTNWMVALSDVAPDGSSVELTRGFLKASHRALDEERSRPWAPFHPHLAAEPVVPGEVVEYAIELSPLANVFAVGHRLKLSVSAMDHLRHPVPDLELGVGHTPWHVCSARTVTHGIHHAPGRASRLLLPVIP